LATQVQRMMELERYDDAAAMLAKSRELSPEAVAPILLMAEVYEQAGKPDKGIEVLQQASQQLPGEPTLKIRLVERLLTRRQFPDAEKLLGQMRQDGKFNATTVDYLLARSAALQGDVKAAHELITQAAAKDPDNPSLKFMMGQLAAQKGDYSTASSMFEQSLAGGNDRQQAVHALFESLLRLGDTSRAIEVLSQAEKRGQEVRDLRKRLLQLLARQENWNTLDAEVSALLTKTPTEDDYLLVVSSFRYVHQPTRAAEFLRKALLDFPASYALREQEVSLLVETEDYDQADRKLSALIAQQPANPMLHVLRIHMYDATKRTEAWKSAVEDAWQKCPGHPAIAALRVRSLLKDGHIEQAMEFAEKARRDYPDLPDPRYLVARMQESLGNTDKALALLNVLVAEDPKNAKAAENYFRLVVQGGLPRDVEPAIEKLISNQPDNAMLIGALAEYKALQGDLASAERTIAKLEGNKNAGSMSDYARAVLAFARRDFKEAERLCNIVTADSKGHMPATFLLARLRAAEGEYSEAIDLAARVCRQQPTNPTSALFLGRLFGETNQWPKCEELCRGFLKEQKSDRSMRLLLARALLARGGDSRSKEAAGLAWSVFEEGIRGGEELEAVMNILFSGGQSEKCRQIISELEARGATPENLLAAGRASFIASDYATAARLADQVLVAKPDDLNALMLAADTETRVGFAGDDPVRYEKAVELYGRILEKDPKSQPAANNLAWTLGVCLGKESRALETLFRHVPAAADRSPMVSLDVLDTVGTLYLRMNRLDQAQEYFETIVQREPSNAMGNFRLGQIFDRRGRGDRAEPCYAKAKKLAPTENWEARKAEAGLGN
jgi:predicted Zn-dependent protease